MKRFNQKPSIIHQENGMASILITLISMIIISLIVIGFSQITQREQRSALDRQLSAQALYAAESGVNDASNAIETALGSGSSVSAKTTCGASPQYSSLNPVLNAAGNVKYTCLLINPAPTSLVFSEIPNGQSKVIQVQSGGATINDLAISWQNSSVPGGATFNCGSGNGYTAFPPAASWNCSAGVLRVDVVPTSNLNSDWVMFLHPQPAPSGQYTTVSYNPSQEGRIVPVDCSSSPNESMTNDCNFVISNLNTNVYLRVESVYSDQNVGISAFSGNNLSSCGFNTCNALPLIDQQVVIDSTGKAQDVLSRVQVRKDINPLSNSVLPSSAVESTNTICKKFAVTNSGPNGSGTWGYIDESTCNAFFNP